MKSISRSASLLIFALLNLAGLVLFSWPLLLDVETIWLANLTQATWLAAIIALFALAAIALQINARLLDSKIVAIVGLLVALIAALRLLGAGAVGIEPMWFLLILASRALGAEIGYIIAILAMTVSAILTGALGPWLPFQVFAAGWIALGAAMVPKFANFNLERVALALYGVFAALVFGLLMDLQLWPWLLGTDTQLSFQNGAAPIENLGRFITFHLATALAWDLPRAIITASLILLTAKPVLVSLRRVRSRLSAGRSNVLAKEEMAA